MKEYEAARPIPYLDLRGRLTMDFIDMQRWIDESYGIDQRDFAGKFDDKRGSLSGDAPERPYWDFWHFMLDHVFDRDHFRNDSFNVLDLNRLRDAAQRRPGPEKWRIKIADMWEREYRQYANALGCIRIWVCW